MTFNLRYIIQHYKKPVLCIHISEIHCNIARIEFTEKYIRVKDFLIK